MGDRLGKGEIRRTITVQSAIDISTDFMGESKAKKAKVKEAPAPRKNVYDSKYFMGILFEPFAHPERKQNFSHFCFITPLGLLLYFNTFPERSGVEPK